MDPASSERSRFREALADVPQKPSRGHCGNGFLHRPNAHVWCSVLLFRHRPRPAEDAAFQCDAKSQCTWVVPQLREAWAYKQPHRFLLHEDRTHLGLANDTPTGRLLKFALRVKKRFNPSRDSAACTIVMRWQRRFKSCFSESQILL